MAELMGAAIELIKWIFKVIVILGLVIMSFKLYEVSLFLVVVAWILFITFAVIWGNLHED